VSELAIPAAEPGLGRALLAGAHPARWAVNLLVLAVPAATGSLGEPATMARVGLAFAAFCLASSGASLLGAARAGTLDLGTAVATALIVWLGGLSLALAVQRPLGGFLAVYVGLGVLSMFSFDSRPVLCVAAGACRLVARVVAGAVAAGALTSGWLLVAVGLAALAALAVGRAVSAARSGEASPATPAAPAAG
jgi:decaprenyl-phosphate phosphoribosyltransferase